MKQCYKPSYPKNSINDSSTKTLLSPPQRNKDFSNTIEYYDIDKKELQNNIKKVSSLGFNYGALTLNTNSFANNSNSININIDYFNNINLTDDPPKYNPYNTCGDKLSRLTNSMSEGQITKRLNKIKNVAKDAPILNLIVLSSNYYKTGKQFKIGPYGIIKNNKNGESKERRYSYRNNESFSISSKQLIHPGIVYFGYYPDKVYNQQKIISLESNDNNKNNNHKKINKLNKNIKYRNNKNIKESHKNKQNRNIYNLANNQNNIDFIDIQVPPWDEDKDKEKEKEDEKEKEKENENEKEIDGQISTVINVSNILELKKYGRYFYIYFNPDYMKYYVKDCGMFYGTFIKIQNELILKDNYVINIGDSYLDISIGIENRSFLKDNRNNESKYQKQIFSQPDSEYDNNLNLKIISKDKIYDPVNFLPTKSKIKIGRASNCEIVIDDILLSRIHCTIEYKNNIGWIIRDGYNNNKNNEESIDIKASTNGTWLFAHEDTPIYEGMILRSDNNLFRCKF